VRRKLVGQKTPIVPNNDSRLSIGRWICRPKISGGLGNAADVFKREIFRDDGPPAVRSKLDLTHESG